MSVSWELTSPHIINFSQEVQLQLGGLAGCGERVCWQFRRRQVSSHSIFSARPPSVSACLFAHQHPDYIVPVCWIFWTFTLTIILFDKSGKILDLTNNCFDSWDPCGELGGWRALNLWDFCFSYLSKVLNIGSCLHRRSDKSEWCVFQSRKVQALRIKEIPCSYK